MFKKTTTTLLTGHILKKAGLDVAVGGNVGTSFASLVFLGGAEPLRLYPK